MCLSVAGIYRDKYDLSIDIKAVPELYTSKVGTVATENIYIPSDES